MQTTIKICSIVSILFMSCSVFSQIDFGIKAGFHSYDLPNTHMDSIGVQLNEADYGFHLGIVTRLKLLGLYIEPGIQFNNIIAKYSVADSTGQVTDNSYVNMDIPLMFGYKLLFLNLNFGPVAHIRLSDYSELLALNALSDKIKKAFWGFQVAAGVHLNQNIFLELRYEKNFKDDQQLSLIDKNSRMLASIGYYF